MSGCGASSIARLWNVVARAAAVAVLAVGLMLAATGCSDDSTSATDGGANDGMNDGATSASDDGTDNGATSASDDGTDSATDDGTDDDTPTDPQGPDIQLFTVPECDVIPGGALSGADVLTIWVAVRNGGPGDVARGVRVTMTSDTGPSKTYTTGISTGSAFSALQVDLSASDYDATHIFTIVADSDNGFAERDESNNQLAVTVRLPTRPSAATTVTCTSP